MILTEDHITWLTNRLQEQVAREVRSLWGKNVDPWDEARILAIESFADAHQAVQRGYQAVATYTVTGQTIAPQRDCHDCKDGHYYPFNGPPEPCRTCNGTRKCP